MKWGILAYPLSTLLGLTLAASLAIYLISSWNKTSWAYRASRITFRVSAGITVAALLAVTVYALLSGWFTATS